MSSNSQNSVAVQRSLQELGFATATLLKEQGVPVDSNRLHSAIQSVVGVDDPEGQLLVLLQVLGIPDLPFVLSEPDAAYMPLLVHHRDLGLYNKYNRVFGYFSKNTIDFLVVLQTWILLPRLF